MLKNSVLNPQYASHSTDNSRQFYPTPENPETVSQTETVQTDPHEPDWEFNLGRDTETGEITSVIAESPDGELRMSLSAHHSPSAIYQKLHRPASRTHEQVTWRKFHVDAFNFKQDGNLYASLLHHPDEPTYSETLSTTEQEAKKTERVVVSVATLVEELIKGKRTGIRRKPTSWAPTPPRWEYDGTAATSYEQRIIPKGSDYERVDSCSDLRFRRIDGDGSRETVRQFLTGQHTPAVEHNLGGIGNAWKAAFGAFHQTDHSDHLIGVIIIDNHPNRAYFEENQEVLISRIACHPHRPKNTSTWMIARARDWAADHGYAQIGATAGVHFNQGMVYKAAGFGLDRDITGWADGAGWQNRDGRRSVNGGNKWYKRKWRDSI